MKTILVTGGNRGIGKEICRQLGELGHMIYLGARSMGKGQKAAEDLKGEIIPVHIDMNDESTFRNVAEKIDHLDVLINNAGIIGETSLDDPDLDEIRSVLETNLFGVIGLTKYFLPHLKQSKDGRIVNMSSGMGAWDSLNGTYASYRLSKASLNAFTVMLAAQLEGRVKVNSMSPGWVRTDMGGTGADRSVEEGAETAVWLATADNIPYGKFLRDKQEIDW
jgi:NAD(P)-dependent dehydrogenase (short-subunit alcohol dehydrogenase family)